MQKWEYKYVGLGGSHNEVEQEQVIRLSGPIASVSLSQA